MKGQVFSIDLLLSVTVFMGVMTIGIITLDDVVEHQMRFSEQDQLRQRASQIADLFVRTSGYPSDWNSSSVQVVGLADRSHVLNVTKLQRLEALDKQKDLSTVLQLHPWQIGVRITQNDSLVSLGSGSGSNGFGGDRVAYIPEESDSFEDITLLQALNGSEVSWDLYWPSTNNQAQLSNLDADHVYNMTADGPAMFEAMLENVSNGEYETVIAEDSNIDTSDISNGDILLDFVETGGTYLHTEDKPVLIESLFGFQQADSVDETGTVIETGPLLNESLEVGDTIEFDDAQMAFEDESTKYVNDTSEPHGCLACRWPYENGAVYYLADTFRSNGLSAGFTNGTAAIDLDLRLMYGTMPGNEAFDIAVNDRSVILQTEDGPELATMEVLVWR